MHYAATLMMTSQILKSSGFTKTQKSRYLEEETLFLLQIKKFINFTSTATFSKDKNISKWVDREINIYLSMSDKTASKTVHKDKKDNRWRKK